MRRSLIVLSVIGLATLLGACSDDTPPEGRKVIVLGFDGFDYKMTRDMMAAGELPNLKKLAEKGGFRPLGTSMPPQSPVAWTNFITGMNPGGHGVFDFLHRDPANYGILNSGAITEDVGFTLSLGKYSIPVTGGDSYNSRKGEAFWDILQSNDVPSYVYRMPANFPMTESEAVTFSGMNTTDIRGTTGWYSFYTSSIDDDASRVEKGDFTFVVYEDNIVKSSVKGPPHPMIEGGPEIKAPFTVYTDPERKMAKIAVGSEEVLVREGEWTDFLTLDFEIIDYAFSVTGIARFYLKEISPQFRMYVSPVNLDPSSPLAPISTPDEASADLADSIGKYYTQGMAEDFNALKEEVLTDAEYIDQARIVFEERKKMFKYAVDNLRSGFLFFYFSSSDLIAHMMYRHMDPDHPYHDVKMSPQFKDIVAGVYKELDELTGQLMAKLDDEDTLMIMSDHGFSSYTRSMNVNTWLEEQGYLVRKDKEKENNLPLMNIDWTKTKAYGFGFNGLYINLAGREGQGIVSPEDKDRLIDKLIKELEAVVDPKTGETAITKVFKASEIYSGDQVEHAPDLVIGFRAKYGASDFSAAGVVEKDMFFDNMNKWSGSHMMDYREVPGVVIANKPIVIEDPKLYDLTTTVLNEFGIEKAENMIGRPIFK